MKEIMFGSGDVGCLVGAIEINDLKCSFLSFAPGQGRGMGEYMSGEELDGRTDVEMGAHVRLVFANVECIDVIIERLEAAKEELVAQRG